jgi:alpha-L-fucosidase
MSGVDWETCMTMNNTWGFRKDDDHWKSPETLIHNLIDTASKGGNFLLNVGPTAEGLIPAASVERLAAMGRWMRVNHDAIYGTSASPFDAVPWGRATRKGSTIYLHVFTWPADGVLDVPLATPVRSARLLAAPSATVQVTQAGGRTRLRVPARAPDPVATVIALQES